jgi:putative ABC transport system substrate-binding protein
VKRREFITLFGGAVVAWPVAALAQQSAMPVIGFLNSASPGPFAARIKAFHDGLREMGFVEGKNVMIEYRWVEGKYEKAPAMMSDLINRGVAAVAAFGPPVARIAKDATSSIPIVFLTGDDPVKAGLVASLNRPGGNVTGVVTLNAELAPKRLEVLRELIPSAISVGLLINPARPNADVLANDMEAAARKLSLQPHVLHASADHEFDAVFATAAQQRIGGVVIATDVFFNSHNTQLGELSARHGVPTIFQFREFAAGGGLLSYAASNTDTYRQVGAYVGRLLKGAKPADLPVVQPAKFDLILNLKTARALGLTVPATLLARATEVIE